MKKLLGRIADYIRETDKVLLSMCIFASLLGAVMVMSATNYTGTAKQFFVQIGALVIGLIAVVVISAFTDYETLTKFWPLYAVLSIGLVVLTFFIGYAPPGTDDKAWLLLPGGITFQPAELLKIAFILTFAKHVSLLGDNIPLHHVLLLCLHGVVPCALIHFQGDDGSALVLAVIFIVMLFAAGVKMRYFAIGASLAAVASPIAWFLVLSDSQRNRFISLFHIEDNLYGDGWQQWRARIAMANGGFFGKGLFRGDYVQSNQVPEGHNDFMFASIGEELGMLGAICVVILLSAICIRILYIAHICGNKMGKIICCGVFGMLAIQSILNIGMCVSLLPVIGITLPFFSAGGSSLVCTFLGIGLVVNVYMHRGGRIIYLHEDNY